MRRGTGLWPTVGRTQLALACTAALGLTACSSSGTTELFVDLRTDLRPGVVFTSVQTALLSPAGDIEDSTATPVRRTDDYREEAGRVAEFGGFEAGEHVLRVALIDLDGRAVTERLVRLRIDGRRQVVVTITSDCAGVTCPTPGDPRDATECLNGRCVASDCIRGTEASCGSAACTAAADCSGTSECGEVRCDDGACLVEPDDALCPAAEICSVPLGCTDGPRDAGVMDAGTSDAGGTDGGAVDADMCGTCDDGQFCNGVETCEGGSCVPGSPPCDPCDESSDTCSECVDDGDCSGSLVCDTSANACVECLGDGDCDGDRWCDEATNACIECDDNADCDDGFFCNGAELCGSGDCRSGSDPCTGGACHEDIDECRFCDDFMNNRVCSDAAVMETNTESTSSQCGEWCEGLPADITCCMFDGTTCYAHESPSAPEFSLGRVATPCSASPS